MIWFLFKMIYRLATLAVLVLVVYFIYATVTGQKAGATELPKGTELATYSYTHLNHAVIMNYASVQVPKEWCAEQEISNKTKIEELASSRTTGMIYILPCQKIDKAKRFDGKTDMIIFEILENPFKEWCKGKETVDLGGKEASCITEIKKNSPSDGVSVAYPIPENKTLMFSFSTDLWKSKKKEILDMIKTTKYVGDAQ